MDKKLPLACLFLVFACVLPGVFSQEPESEPVVRTIPDALRRPERGEAPRYPQDLVIGELGRGNAPDAAYRFAGELLKALVSGNAEAPVLAGSGSVLAKNLLEELEDLDPRSFRLGGGRIEADGSVSFMVRFLGPEKTVTGELFLRREGDPGIPVSGESTELAAESRAQANWLLDDLVLEEKKALGQVNDSYRYDFSPYERFY